MEIILHYDFLFAISLPEDIVKEVSIADTFWKTSLRVDIVSKI